MPNIPPKTEDVPPRSADETEFTDERGSWIARKVAARVFGYDPSTIRDFVHSGRLDRRRLPCVRCPFWREYVSKGQLEAMSAVRRSAIAAKRAGTKVVDPDWSNAAEVWDKFRLSRSFLTRHSLSLLRERKRASRVHQYLGKLIDAKVRDYHDGELQRHEQVWRNEHLQQIADARKQRQQPVPKTMMLLVDAAEEFGWSVPGLALLARQGHFYATKRRGSRRNGKPADVWYVNVKAVRAMTEQTKRPGDDRTEKIGGEDFVPLTDAAERAGVHWRYLVAHRNSPAKRWGGIIVKATRAKVSLFRSKWGPKAWVYRVRDLDAVRRHVEGWNADDKASTPTVAVRKGRGRPRVENAVEDRRLGILSRWAAAHEAKVTRASFCADEKISIDQLVDMQSWLATRAARRKV